MSRTLWASAVFLAAAIACACSASMRPIPDDVQPVPESVRASALADGGAILALLDAGGRFAELPHTDHAAVCANAQHHMMRVHQIAPDRWTMVRGVIDLVRTERKASIVPQFDNTGKSAGLLVDDIGESSCLGALGFRTGDVLYSLNDHVLADWSTYYVIYQSIIKDGVAIVRFERAGKMLTTVYEVRNE